MHKQELSLRIDFKPNKFCVRCKLQINNTHFQSKVSLVHGASGLAVHLRDERKTFHHSAFFEGIGFAVGSDPSGVAYSHGVWYNGIELKDLNKAIPGFDGWEINLANSINDKGQIAGSGFFKALSASKGSLITKAVLLTPAGLSLRLR